MINIWQITNQALAPLNLPVMAAAMLSALADSQPDTYLVYQMVSDPPVAHADDDETARRYRMQVSVFARSGLDTLPAQVETAMKAAGFTHGSDRELNYEASTRHFGLAMDFSYLEDTNG